MGVVVGLRLRLELREARLFGSEDLAVITAGGVFFAGVVDGVFLAGAGDFPVLRPGDFDGLRPGDFDGLPRRLAGDCLRDGVDLRAGLRLLDAGRLRAADETLFERGFDGERLRGLKQKCSVMC